MIKKVRVDDLRVGVYVHDYNCSGNSGAIYIDPGPIKRESAIRILKTWGIGEVYIDTARGLDIDRLPKNAGPRKVTAPSGAERPRPRPQAPLTVEMRSAQDINRDAMQTIEQAYQTAKEGSVPEAGDMYKIAERMYDSIHRNSDALTLLGRIREKDTYTLQHSVSVCSYVLTMCQYYNMPEGQSLDFAVAALFHDIGKALVPLEILNKPGRLDPKEFEIMQRHARYSDELLSDVRGIPPECRDVALHHHERFNGTGYPSGLARNQISFAAQLTSVCDVFDALVSERVYKPGMETVMALRIIYEGSGSHFDRDLAYDFIRCIGMYPVGTCVSLDDGRSGIVVGSTEDLKRPIVQVLYDENRHAPLPKPVTIDLSKSEGMITSYANANRFGFQRERDLLNRFMTTT